MNIIEVEAFIYDKRKPDQSTYHMIAINMDHVVVVYPNLGDYHHYAISIIHLTTGATVLCKSHLPHELVPRPQKTPDPYY